MGDDRVRFGVLVLPHMPWTRFAEQCLRIDEIGFDSLGRAITLWIRISLRHAGPMAGPFAMALARLRPIESVLAAW